MSAATPHGSALRALVFFMVCLSIAGTLIAVAHWVVFDKPQQDALGSATPSNGGFFDCHYCLDSCSAAVTRDACLAYCEQIGSCDHFMK